MWIFARPRPFSESHTHFRWLTTHANTILLETTLCTAKLFTPQGLQEVKREMECSGTHAEIFPEMFKLLNILIAMPVGTATAERSFSQ